MDAFVSFRRHYLDQQLAQKAQELKTQAEEAIEELRRSLTMMFEFEGFDCETASSGPEAVQVIERAEIDRAPGEEALALGEGAEPVPHSIPLSRKNLVLLLALIVFLLGVGVAVGMVLSSPGALHGQAPPAPPGLGARAAVS